MHCQQPFCPNGNKQTNKQKPWRKNLSDSLILSCLLIILLLGHVLLAGKLHIHNLIQALKEKDYCPVENRLGEKAYPPYFGQTKKTLILIIFNFNPTSLKIMKIIIIIKKNPSTRLKMVIFFSDMVENVNTDVQRTAWAV